MTRLLVPVVFLAALYPYISALKIPAKSKRSFSISSPGFRTTSNSSSKFNKFASLAAVENGTLSLVNTEDVVYSTVITLGGKDYQVNIDTGSSDLWVYPANGERINTVQTTSVGATVEYAKGGITGDIAFASLKMGSYSVDAQAFINVEESEDMEAVFATGSRGLLGLSFDSASQVTRRLVSAGYESSVAFTPLTNVFAKNPTIPNFLTILLGRANDTSGETDGVFTISEYVDDSLKTAIDSQPKAATGPKRWYAVVQGLTVNGKQVPLSSNVTGAESGTAITMLDTGFSLPPVPLDVAAAIYDSIDGAIAVPGEPGIYIVPCMKTAAVTWKVNGVDVPIHPLDLTTPAEITIPDGTNRTFCINTFQGDPLTSFPDLDMIHGDAFLKNVYTLFDFGDSQGNDPFIQILPITTVDEANQEFNAIRPGVLSHMAEEVAPSELLKLLSGESSGSSSGSNKNGAVSQSSLALSTVLAIAIGTCVSMWI